MQTYRDIQFPKLKLIFSTASVIHHAESRIHRQGQSRCTMYDCCQCVEFISKAVSPGCILLLHKALQLLGLHVITVLMWNDV